MKHNIVVLLLFAPSLLAMNEIPQDKDGYIILEDYQTSEFPDGPIAIERDKLNGPEKASIGEIAFFVLPCIAIITAAAAKSFYAPEPEPIPPTAYETCINVCKGIFQRIHR